MEKEPIKIYGSDGLAGRVALFNQKATNHKDGQKANPFSGSWDGKVKYQALGRQDPNYGRPVQGSKTEYRGKKAGELISNEIKLLCDMIWEFGTKLPDETAWITFGELFGIYARISNKLVGTLLRARKHGLLNFQGEMLFQRRDDDVVIELAFPIQEIRKASGSVNRPPTDSNGSASNSNEVEACGSTDT